MKFSPTEATTKQPAVSVHEGLKDYERGTTTWIGQVGHWHVIENGGRRWIKGPVTACPDLRRARP
jgi:hypothetical protein